MGGAWENSWPGRRLSLFSHWQLVWEPARVSEECWPGPVSSEGHPSDCRASESILNQLRRRLAGYFCCHVPLPGCSRVSVWSSLWPLGSRCTCGLWLLVVPRILSSWPWSLACCSSQPCAVLGPFWRPHQNCGKNLLDSCSPPPLT